jgi:enoyl-CoA hydratase
VGLGSNPEASIDTIIAQPIPRGATVAGSRSLNSGTATRGDEGMSDFGVERSHESGGDTIAVSREGPVAILRIDRPPANAIDLGLARRMETVFDELMAAEPAALVVTGTGRFFSGGLDLKAVPTYGPEEQRAMLLVLNRVIARLYACPVPVVGAINGHAIAGAFILALTADYRVGPSEGAWFGLTEARVGIPFPAAAMIVLRGELAPQDVRFFTLWSRNVSPEEAQRRGVLDERVGRDAVLPRALDVARDMARIPADAYRRIKVQIRNDAIVRLEELNAGEDDPMLASWLSPESAAAAAGVLRGDEG